MSIMGELYLDRGISAVKGPISQTAANMEKLTYQRYNKHNSNAYILFNMIADLGCRIKLLKKYDLDSI